MCVSNVCGDHISFRRWEKHGAQSQHYAALRLKIPMYLRMLTTSRPMRATMTHHRRKLLASANGSSGSSHDFIASHGLPASPVIPGLAALAVMANACIPAHFSSSALVAGQILDSGRDLTQVPPGIFEELRLSEFRVELFPPPPLIGGDWILAAATGLTSLCAADRAQLVQVREKGRRGPTPRRAQLGME